MRRRHEGGHDVEDLHVESVGDDGVVICRLPGGGAFALQVGRELVPYYRRLVAAEPTEQR